MGGIMTELSLFLIVFPMFAALSCFLIRHRTIRSVIKRFRLLSGVAEFTQWCTPYVMRMASKNWRMWGAARQAYEMSIKSGLSEKGNTGNNKKGVVRNENIFI